MAQLIDSDGNQGQNYEDANVRRQPNEPSFEESLTKRPHVEKKPDTLGDSPKWYLATLGLCAFIVGFCFIGLFFFVPEVIEPEVDTAAIEAEVAAQQKSPEEQVEEVFSKEDASRLSNKAFELASQVAEHQSAYRSAAAESPEREAEELSLTQLLSGSPKQAVGWYIPKDDVVFTWYTYTPYIFEQREGSGNQTPRPRVLWLAKDPQGVVLAWAMGTYDEDENTFVDLTYGQTQYGASLMPYEAEPSDGDGSSENSEQTAPQTDADGNPLSVEQQQVISLFQQFESVEGEVSFNQTITPEAEAEGRAAAEKAREEARQLVEGNTQ